MLNLAGIYNYFVPKSSSQVASDTYDKETQRWLDAAYKCLCREGIELSFFRHIHKQVTELKVTESHPVAKKIQEFLLKYPPLSTATPSDHAHLPTATSQANAREQDIPSIDGPVLDVNCTLATTKLIIKKSNNQFTKIILHDVDDELLSLIAEHCPQLEALIIATGFFTAGTGFTDKGMDSIVTLQKLKTLDIRSWMSMKLGSEGFEKLLSAQWLQKGLNHLTIHDDSLNDKLLSLIARCQSLKSLNLVSSSGITSQGLLSFCQSLSLQATLESITIMSYNKKPSFNDAILAALSNFKLLKNIDLDSSWQIQDSSLISFLNAHKNASSLGLKGLTLSAAGAAKIKEMEALASLQIDDCSALYALGSPDFYNLLDNKTLLTQLNLNQVGWLGGSAPISNLPRLKVLNLAGSLASWYSFSDFCKALEMQKHFQELYLTNWPRLVDNQSFANIAHLKALTVLRIDRCPQFNDDAMKSIFETSVKDQLITLQLKDVSTTERSFKYLNEASKLEQLLIANWYATTEEGRPQFFEVTPKLQKQLKVLGFVRFSLSLSMVNELDKFSSLTRLVISNDYRVMGGESEEKLYERKANSGGRFDLIIWLGSDNDGTLYQFFNGPGSF